jgi:rhodanese-related sulfurtransferase
MKSPTLVLATLIFTLSALTSFAAEIKKMSAQTAAQLVAEGKAVLVDVREPAEVKESGTAGPAVLLPKSDFDGDQKLWKPFLAANAGKEIILFCRGGGRAGEVCSALGTKGVKAANLGGLKDWTNAGLPTRTADAPATKK